LLGLLAALLMVGCSTSPAEQTGGVPVDPTATFSPADATATWVAFKPERDRIAADLLEQQSAQQTVVAATQLAMEPLPTAINAVPDPTPLVLPERAIPTGVVDRIAFSNGSGSVFTVNPDGTDSVAVAEGSTLNGEFRYTFPVWSPDGGTVSFSSFLIVEDTVSQSSLHRADADGNGVIVTLAIDPTSQSGVGPGVPHFTTWSPNGDRIALTTSGEFGIGTMLLGSYSGENPKGIAIGAPLYINWAPDGSSILIHQEAGLHLTPVDGATSGLPRAVGTGSVSFNSPSWAPDSRSFVHVDTVDGNRSVVITQASDLTIQSVVGDGDTRVGLGWSPNGDKIAIAYGSGTSFHTVSLYDVEAEIETVLYEGEVRAFWWSPDESKLAIVEDSSDIDLAHTWSVIDVESTVVTPLVTQVASDEFLFVQVFFDQYVDSHNIWSPDSTRLVISGAILDLDEVLRSEGDVNLPEQFDSQIWVLDANGDSEPISVGRGTIASWSPR
jgi:TolB protein